MVIYFPAELSVAFFLSVRRQMLSTGAAQWVKTYAMNGDDSMQGARLRTEELQVPAFPLTHAVMPLSKALNLKLFQACCNMAPCFCPTQY